jgi:hypothetical protein
MAVYKRGDVSWYELVFKGERIRDTSHTGNKEATARWGKKYAAKKG